MDKFGVSERKKRGLAEKMEALKVKESDLDEKFIRAKGKGGQNVNKVSTCVYIRHRPTGFEVKCSRERKQGLNRFIARRMLLNKIEKRFFGEISEERSRREKIRRQKRKRSKRAKEKMLDKKKKQALKKELRKPVHEEE
jgi:protein subunit release factor B